jgi:hypothetical protein
MACSLIFTLLLLPCMLRLGKSKRVKNIATDVPGEAALEPVA